MLVVETDILKCGTFKWSTPVVTLAESQMDSGYYQRDTLFYRVLHSMESAFPCIFSFGWSKYLCFCDFSMFGNNL